MRPENKIIHTVWIGDRLSLLERLTIVLFQSHGHEVHLWSYRPLQNVPSETISRDASEVLPESSLFRFEGLPLKGIPAGGIGSLSHWSDQFQMKLLHQYGGIYSQLDIASFAPLDFTTPYVFAPHTDRTIAPVVMKCPKGSEFAQACYARLSAAINAQTIRDLDWNCSMRLIKEVAREFGVDRDEHILSDRIYLDLGCRKKGPFYDGKSPRAGVEIIHWSNATNRRFKDDPIPGSYYEALLRKAGLVPKTEPVLRAFRRRVNYLFSSRVR